MILDFPAKKRLLTLTTVNSLFFGLSPDRFHAADGPAVFIREKAGTEPVPVADEHRQEPQHIDQSAEGVLNQAEEKLKTRV